MKAAIWGAGNIAATHAEALKACGIKIHAVVDADKNKAEAFARQWDIPEFGTEPEVLYPEAVTAVHVCTPPALHYEMVKSLLEHGKHVLCEKPLCFEVSQAQELAETAKASGLCCAVNFNIRFHMACQKAKRIAAAPEFGPIRLIHGSYLQEYHTFPTPWGWRYNEALAGKMRAVTEIGSHWMDMAQFISGKKITAVSAVFGKFNPQRYLENGMMYSDAGDGRQMVKVESEDAALINLRFEDGALGSVVLSEVSQGRVNRLSLEVTGAGQNLWWNSEDNNLLHTAVKGGGVNSEIFAFGNGFMDTFRSLISSYYEDIKRIDVRQQSEYPDFEQGSVLVRLCDAVLKSAEQDGLWISVQNDDIRRK